jgi:hypothetical protein
VSGGAAWADHLAVTLFLNGKVPRLHLHLPAPWNFVSNAFTDTRDGRTANRLHSRFSDRSLTEIGQALLSGATYDVSDGFKTRNILVGQVDRLIAFTWSHTGSPKLGGGTRHCWDNSLASVKVHIDLGTL